LSYKVLARTYRPQRFDALIGQEVVGRTLANAIGRNRVHHAYLFCGPRGVGKTSAARILAMALNCEHGPAADPCGNCAPCTEVAAGRALDVQEIDGASHNGVDHVRQLQESAYTRPSLRAKIFIIDEVHMLTNQAFNALLKLLEEPPPSVHFIFATTEPHKVLDTIKSRCQRHDFKRIPTRRITDQLDQVCRAEGLEVGRDALRVVAAAAEGGMRDALSLLEQVIAYTGGAVEGAQAAECLGLVDRRAVLDLLRALREEDRAGALGQLDALYAAGSDLRRFADALVMEVRSLVLCTEIKQPDALLDLDAEALAQLRAVAEQADPGHMRRWLRIALDAAAEINRTGHPRTVLELAILRMADAAGAMALSELLGHLQGGSAPPRPAGNRKFGGPPQQARPQAPAPQQARPQAPAPQQARPQAPAPQQARPQAPAPQQARPQAPASQGSAQALGLRGPAAPAGQANFEQGPPPGTQFLHAVAHFSQPLAATLALAGLRVNQHQLVGRLDTARLAIVRQDRSRQDVARALQQTGFKALVLGDLKIEAASQSSIPSEVPERATAPAPQAPSKTVKKEPEAKAVALPELNEKAHALLALWASIYTDLPNALKGRLVPFAPVAREDDVLVVASETEGLIEAMSEALAALELNHDGIRRVRAESVASDGLPMFRSMLRYLRAQRDPIYREKIELRQHETTQAIVDLFGATVDEVGL
jgi:DNA polymerase-3 subunit gamma/tau